MVACAGRLPVSGPGTGAAVPGVETPATAPRNPGASAPDARSAASDDAGASRLTTLETTDPGLMAALARSAAAPRAASHRTTADAYARLCVVDAALGHLQLALDADPRDPETLEARARLWRDAGFPQMALGDAYRALHYSRGSASAHNTLGTVLQALGRRGEAARHYRLAAAVDAGAAYAWNNLCYASLLDDQAVEAIERCRQALRLDPDLTAAHNNLGLAYAAAGDLGAARAAFERAGSPAATAFNMGIVQLSVGMFRDAAASFEHAGRLQPAWAEPPVRLRQASSRVEEGRPE